MPSIELAHAHLLEVFPAQGPPAPAYRSLALAEANSTHITSVTSYISGTLRHLSWVAATIKHTEKGIYYNAMLRRQELLLERLKHGEVNASSIMPVTALAEAGRYARLQVERLKWWLDQGYKIGWYPVKLPKGQFGRLVDSTIVCTGGKNPDHTGVYATLWREVQIDDQPQHELWLPDHDLVVVHQQTYAELCRQTLPFEVGLQIACRLAGLA